MNEAVLSNLNVITKVLDIYHPIELKKPIFSFNLNYIESSIVRSFLCDKLILLIVTENHFLTIKIISTINFNRAEMITNNNIGEGNMSNIGDELLINNNNNNIIKLDSKSNDKIENNSEKNNENIIWCNKNYDYLDKNIKSHNTNIDNLIAIRINEENKLNSFDLSSASIKQKYKKLKDKINIIKNKNTTISTTSKSVIDLLTNSSLFKISVNYLFEETILISKLQEMEFNYYVIYILDDIELKKIRVILSFD